MIVRHRGAAEPRESPQQLPASFDGDLLAEDRARADLETLPPAGSAQPGTLRDERREEGILRQVRADGDDVRAEVEHTANA